LVLSRVAPYLLGLALPVLPVTAADVGQIFGVKAQGDQLVVRALDLTAATLTPDGRQVFVEPGRTGQRLGALSVLSDGRVVLWSAVKDTTGNPTAQLETLGSSTVLKQPAAAAPLVSTSSSTTATPQVTHTPLPTETPEQPVGSLVQQPSLGLIALVGNREDTPAFKLTVFDPATGATHPTSVALSPQARYANLALCPNGTTYATSITSESGTLLVKLDTTKNQFVGQSQLTNQGKRLARDLAGLVCSAGGVLYGLGDFTRAGFNSLWQVDPASGVLTLLVRFDVDRITYSK
jgi:hypothetical protein